MTSRPWRLTPLAEESLSEIAAWTIRTFGPAQADAYEAEPIARCRAIADGAAASQDCSLLATGASGLRFTRAVHDTPATAARGFPFQPGREIL